MKNSIFKIIFRCVAVLVLMSLTWMIPVWAKDNSASGETQVRSSANTGGNSGENVETGSASARSSVKTEVNGSAGENKIKVDASAEANGKKVEVKAESSGGEDINIQKEITEEGASASVDVKIDQPEVEGFRAVVFSKISNAIGSLFDKLLSIFS